MAPNKTPSFSCSMESRQLADWLIKQAEAGDHERIIPWEELSKAAGVDVKVKTHVLQTARNRAIKEAGVDYGTVRGQGVQLLDSRGLIGVGESNLASTRRRTRKALTRMAHVKFNELTESDKIRHNAVASFNGVMLMMTGKASRKRLEGAVANAQAKLPVKETFLLFGAAPNGDA
jgi:hypothetical protein